MTSNELKQRTKKFALDILELTDGLPKNGKADLMGRQLLRSATSVTSNSRAAFQARSKADFVSKITVVEEEADELTAIFTASGKNARWNK